MSEKEKIMQARIQRRREQQAESVYDVYNMHKSSFISGKVQARILADNRRFLNISAHLP